jgi:hypothetical protein
MHLKPSWEVGHRRIMSQRERILIDPAVEPRWVEAFRPLAVRRCGLFFDAVGLPPEMIERPQLLRRVARRLLEQPWSYPGSPYPSGWGRHGVRAFRRLGEHYGDAATNGLADWMVRYFVDEAQRSTWQAWAEICVLTPGSYRAGTLRFPLPFDPPQARRLVATMERADLRAEWEALHRLAKQAERIPLSKRERWLLELEPEAPGAEPYLWDVVGDLRIVGWMHRAFRVWPEMATWLSPEDCRKLQEWARQSRPFIQLL